MYLALNNLQRLICPKTQQTKANSHENICLSSLLTITGERGTIFLFWLFHLHPPQHVWYPPQRSPRASENQPSAPEAGLISTN